MPTEPPLEDDRVKHVLARLEEERDELRVARQELERRANAATQKLDDFVFKAQQQVFDSVSEVRKVQPEPRFEQRVVALVVVVLVGLGSIGYHATGKDLQRNAAEERACWMGAPCNPTGLSLCQNALPQWKCRVQ